ncbi:Thioesterase PikA5 [Nocardiopsis dassonvillei]|uniref:thioesterase II family protein n=1 Tax=Nocardiopsis dassonvillei TaxID=2014 RepID=UPI003F561D5A
MPRRNPATGRDPRPVDADAVLWNLREAPAPNGPCLVLLPHAGGSAHYYTPWADRLPAEAGLRIAQYPGRGNRFAEGVPASMAELSDPVAAVLLEHPGDVVLFGHSMGSLVAYEVARRLTARGRPPSALIVSACRAPFLANPSPVHPAALTDADLVEALRRRGGTDPAILGEPELHPVILPPVRADFAIDDEYRCPDPAPTLDCPVVVVGGEADPVVPVAALRAWEDVTGGRTRVRTVPGGHFYFDEAASSMASLLDTVRATVHGVARNPDPETARAPMGKGWT